MKATKKSPYNYYQQPGHITQTQSKTRHIKAKRILKKKSVLSALLPIVFVSLLAVTAIPYTFQHTFQPIIKTFVKDTIGSTVDYNYIYNKSAYTLHNDSINGQRVLLAPIKKTEMSNLYETDEMLSLKKDLENLLSIYPMLGASIYVWDYKSGKYVDFNADKRFSAASIIKIPVLLELFKSIELGRISLQDKFILTDVYRASGSGDLQYKPENSIYTVDELARMMMRDSDNSATNILMYLTGGSVNVNRSLRNWGMKISHVENWLPDLGGENKTTAREMATMLFNIENPNFLSLNSREHVIDYLSDIKNNRLIHAGLPKDALFIHKTGDIGTMLGDAGIVYAPTGEKYAVAILVERPYNAVQGKEFIVKASEIIYHYVTQKI